MSPTLTRNPLTAERTHLRKNFPRAIASWAEKFPCLGEVDGYDELIALLRSKPKSPDERQRSNQVLWSLLVLAVDDLEAAGIVLHAMENVIGLSAARCAGRFATRDDALSASIEAMWHAIRNFPTHRRPDAAAANLYGEFLHVLCGRKSRREVDVDEPLGVLEEESIDVAPLETGPQDREVVLEIIALAHDAGALSTDEARLMLATHVDASTNAELCALTGLSPALLRQRKSRATRRLIAWAKTNI